MDQPESPVPEGPEGSEAVANPVADPPPSDPPPSDPAVQAMEQCLAAGDHRATRARAEVLAKSEEAGQREAGRAMLERLRPDARVSAVFVLTGGLMLALALHWLGHRA